MTVEIVVKCVALIATVLLIIPIVIDSFERYKMYRESRKFPPWYDRILRQKNDNGDNL